jgi:hypothetical protein
LRRAQKICGEGGIRTRGTLAGTHDFQSCTFGHSVTSPGARASSRLTEDSAHRLEKADARRDTAAALALQGSPTNQREIEFFRVLSEFLPIRPIVAGFVPSVRECKVRSLGRSLRDGGEHEDFELRRRSRRARAPAVPLRVHMISNHAPSATRSPLLALGPRHDLPRTPRIG